MIIHDIKDDHVLQVSGQEPSMSSKSPPSWHTSNKDINLKFSGYLPGAKIWFSPWHQRCPYPPFLKSGTLNVLQDNPFFTPLREWTIRLLALRRSYNEGPIRLWYSRNMDKCKKSTNLRIGNYTYSYYCFFNVTIWCWDNTMLTIR